MNKYIIQANNTNLDTYEELDISLNYQIDDILKISKRNSNFSKSILLPGTPINDKFFKQIFDVNVNNVSFNPNRRIPATIRVGDNEIFKGFLRLVRITERNKSFEYEVNIFGSLKDIVKEVQDFTLRDLDLSKFNHIRNIENEKNSWDYNIHVNGIYTSIGGPGTGYVYPYIVNGNSTGIYNTVYGYDLFPATYVKTIWDAMFEEAGFTYTSNFINSEYFSKLILPFTGDKLELNAEAMEEKSVRAGVPAGSSYVDFTPEMVRGTGWYYNNTLNYFLGSLTRESGEVSDSGSDLEFTDDLGQWSNDIFTCAQTGRYNISFDGKCIAKYTHDNGNDVEFKSGDIEYRYMMYLLKTNGTSVLLDSSIDPNDPNDIYGVLQFAPSSGSHPTPWYDIDTSLVFATAAEDVFMEAGDKVYIRCGINYNDNVKWQGSSDQKTHVTLTFKQSYDQAFTKFVVVPSSSESLGNEMINLSDTLPEKYKQKDFLFDMINMFNLVVQDNPNKVDDLIIEPRDDFFSSRQRVVEWDDKLDNDASIKVTPMSELDARSYKYTYKKDDDFYNKEYTSETGQIYGEHVVDVINDFSDKTHKTTVTFSPTPDAEKFIGGKVAPFFVTKDDDDFRPKKVKPRILFYGGLLNTYSGLNLKEYPGIQNFYQFDQYPYCGMWDHPTDPMHDLGFGKTKKIYWGSSVVSNNTLFEEFHKSTLENITDINSRLLEADFVLTPKDIADFDFRDIIFLRGSYWRVNKIKDYNPVGSDSTTKVILYKLVNITVIAPYQVDIPDSSVGCPPDMVSIPGGKGGTILASHSGAEVTEDCCNKFGGVMIHGVCYLKSQPHGGDNPGPYPGNPIKVPYTNNGGGNPVSNPTGPIVFEKDNTTRGTLGVITKGTGNFIPKDADIKLVLGDYNSVSPNVKDTIIVGDGIRATESGTLYLGDIKLGQDGNITANGINIIDGGEDEVFDFDKTNLIDIIDGTVDDVRNPGGDSKARPIIDGNPSDI